MNSQAMLSTSGCRIATHSATDLHLHSTYSDGRWSPELLVKHLLREQFRLAAVADHDRVDTAPAIQQLALDHGMPLLVAVEMTASWRGEMTDLLCFGFDPNQNALNDLAQDLLRRQKANTQEVYDNLLRLGYALSHDGLTAILAKPSSQHPDALVSLLKEHCHGLVEPSASRIAMEAGCTFAANDPAAVVEAAHRSGAVCLLAHPGRSDGFVTYDSELLDEFRRDVPIDGLEVYNPVHSRSQIAMYREYAQRHHLLISAGSDSHGPDRPPIKYPASLSRGLLDRLGIRID